MKHSQCRKRGKSFKPHVYRKHSGIKEKEEDHDSSMFWCIDSQCLFHIFEVGYFVAQAGLKLLSPRITNGRQSGSVLTDKH